MNKKNLSDWWDWCMVASGSFCFATNALNDEIMGFVGRTVGLFVLAAGIIFVLLTELRGERRSHEGD